MKVLSILQRHESTSRAPWYLSLAAMGLLGWSAVGDLPRSFAQEAGQPPTLPPTEVKAAPPTQPVMDGFEQGDLSRSILDGTIFSNQPTEGYRAETSTTGTIIAIPDADLPATVNTITRDTLNDQSALRFQDVIRNAGGVVFQGDSQFFDRILIRGQQLTSSNFRKDGFLDRTGVPRDFQNVERIEILKGPASILYGAGDAAGLVNLITKKPLDAQFANFGYTFGAYEQSRFTVDANNVSTSGNILFRLNAAQEDVNGFVDFDYTHRTQIAPVVTFLLDQDTTLTWNGEWHKDHRRGNQGTPAVFGDPLFLEPNVYVGEPANDFFAGEEFRQSLVLNHQINDDWFFSIGGYSLFVETPSSTTAAAAPFIPIGPPVSPVDPFFNRVRSNSPYNDEETHSLVTNLGGEFWTGEMKHKFLVGMEYAYLNSNSEFTSNSAVVGAIPNPGIPMLPPFIPIFEQFDVTNPVYNNLPTQQLFGIRTNDFRQQRVGGYVQDLVEITPYWKALGGVRVDTVDFYFNRSIDVGDGSGFGPDQVTEQNFNRASPRGGLIYQPWADESLAFYYSYTQSFSPPGGGAYFLLPGQTLRPVLGESHEAGIKTLLVDGLSLTACGYRTVRQNDTFNPNPGVFVQVGEVETQGAEINLIGNITSDWSMIANYCYCDSAVFNNDPLLMLDGARARNVPYNNANIWSRYNLVNDGYQTWGAALGWVYVGERQADLDPNAPNAVDLPSYSRFDAGLYYQKGQFNTGVYLENLGNIQYALGSSNSYQIYQGAPFNVRATVSYLY
ncbi:putative TonB-dependent receptor BfrD precursor [Anatilimnocola aggregata]|uniref:Putative TonB-dependent receptor BfrD n=1 Tax=Anatilimnocola aggregata TaxID=2528021 RepID=A0A517Y6Q5_9BACT|nr:TonB-dependent siderophore receptor [Anatilimnocola aggregata]QDU25900.1 putative TonB-dependent receptor BfrD precursor [Anatilimnocola aggregata]